METLITFILPSADEIACNPRLSWEGTRMGLSCAFIERTRALRYIEPINAVHFGVQGISKSLFPGLANFVPAVCLPLLPRLTCSILTTWERPYRDSLYMFFISHRAGYDQANPRLRDSCLLSSSGHRV